MTIYIINENVTANELKSIKDNLLDQHDVKIWPDNSSNVPNDTELSILIIKEDSSDLEEKRVINLINKGIRIICIYLETVQNISPLAKKYCSVKVLLEGGDLLDAVNGNDLIQQDQKGREAPKNPQKRHTC